MLRRTETLFQNGLKGYQLHSNLILLSFPLVLPLILTWKKALLQCGQTWDRSPVCHIQCFFSSCRVPNSFPHWVHWKESGQVISDTVITDTVRLFSTVDPHVSRQFPLHGEHLVTVLTLVSSLFSGFVGSRLQGHVRRRVRVRKTFFFQFYHWQQLQNDVFLGTVDEKRALRAKSLRLHPLRNWWKNWFELTVLVLMPFWNRPNFRKSVEFYRSIGGNNSRLMVLVMGGGNDGVGEDRCMRVRKKGNSFELGQKDRCL